MYGQIVFFLGAAVMILGGMLMHFATEKKHSYLVTLSFPDGAVGRSFVTRNNPITTSADIEELDALITKSWGRDEGEVFIINYIEFDGIKEEKEKSP